LKIVVFAEGVLFKIKKAVIGTKMGYTKMNCIDFDSNFLRFHEGIYEMGKGELQCKPNCLIKNGLL
jgi:hypothetical protein